MIAPVKKSTESIFNNSFFIGFIIAYKNKKWKVDGLWITVIVGVQYLEPASSVVATDEGGGKTAPLHNDIIKHCHKPCFNYHHFSFVIAFNGFKILNPYKTTIINPTILNPVNLRNPT